MTDATATRKFPSTKVLTVFLSISSVTAVVLALLGYGVALSAEASFGIPHAVIFNSTSDLLTLGGWAVMQVLLIFSKLSEWSFYVSVWEAIWSATKTALGVPAVVLVLSGLWFAVRYRLQRLPSLRDRVEQIRGSKHRKIIAIAGALGFALAAPLVAIPLAALVTLVGLILLATLLSIVPMAGLHAGKAHIDDWVIGPAVCAPLKPRAMRVQAQRPAKDGEPKYKVSTCVAVRKTSGTEYRGRVVFATFNAVVLYEPEAGSVRRVSTEDASVEVIDKL